MKVRRGRPQLARGLQINVVEDGYIIYQPRRDRVHYLNPTAALVVELCTGKNTWDEIIDLVQAAWDLKQSPRRVVSDVLTQVIDEGIVRLGR